MKRWVWHIFCLFSLLVFAGSVTIGVRSYSVADSIVHTTWRTETIAQETVTRVERLDFSSNRGVVALSRFKINYFGVHSPASYWDRVASSPRAAGAWPTSRRDRLNIQLAGFALICSKEGVNFDWRLLAALAIPLWLFLPAAIPPVIWLRRRRRARGRGFPVVTAAEK